jgi:hypothetical protein
MLPTEIFVELSRWQFALTVLCPVSLYFCPPDAGIVLDPVYHGIRIRHDRQTNI